MTINWNKRMDFYQCHVTQFHLCKVKYAVIQQSCLISVCVPPNVQTLPAILAYKGSEVSMTVCIMDSLCHFLFMEYGQ